MMSSSKSKRQELEEESREVKRLKGRHSAIKCVIQLENGFISRELMARLVCEICKYLLYDRQQIPFPLSNSQSLVQLNDKSITSKLSTKEELILLIINDLNKLFDELVCVMKLDDICIECVSLSLGQTLQMPKELYCIEMPAIDIYNVKHSLQCKAISLRSAVTRFFKTILNDGNILFQSRKDIAITKIFLLVKLKRSDVSLVMEHSHKFHSISDECSPLFTPHVNYELPKVGNRFKFTIKQKQCECSFLPNQQHFEIYDENKEHKSDYNCVDQELSETISHLSINNSSSNLNKSEDDFIWVQIRSSIKGVLYNNANKGDLLLT